MSRHRDGSTVKKSYGIRLEPQVVAKIIEQYGSLTNFVNEKISKDKKLNLRGR